MTTQPLPTFLADLAFTLEGQPYQLFAVPNKTNWFIFGLKDDGYYNYGVLVNFDEEMAEIKDNHSIKKYSTGHTKPHTHWDGDDLPKWVKAEPFEVWIRQQVLKDIDRQLAWHLERTFRKHPLYSNLTVYEKLCENFAKLPNFEFTHHRNDSLKFSLLAAIHRSRCSGGVTEADHAIFEQFMDEIKTGELFKREEHQFLSLMLNLLTTVPDCITTYHESIVTKIYDLSKCKEDNPLQFTTYWIQNLKNQSPKVRSVHHQYLLPICNTPTLCHTIAAGLFEWPEEAELYLEKGLSLRPDNISLLMIAETFYLNHPKSDMLERIRLRIKAMGVNSSSTKNIQRMINRYTRLCNDYQYFDPSTNTKKTARELLRLEAKLNRHWLHTLPNPTCLSRPIVEQQLIDQNRFLSAGSASICGWMRNQKRYQEVVDYMMPLVDQGELCLLRHKTNSWGFEAFMGNGLSCFLDSQVEEHIPQAIQIMDVLEQHISNWTTRHSLYAFACVAARANQLDRALKYVRQALNCDVDITNFANDSDMVNLHDHPDFIELLDKEYS